MDRNLKELTANMQDYLQGEIIQHDKHDGKHNFISIPNNATELNENTP